MTANWKWHLKNALSICKWDWESEEFTTMICFITATQIDFRKCSLYKWMCMGKMMMNVMNTCLLWILTTSFMKESSF